MKDRDAWLAFVSGEPEYVWNKPQKISRKNRGRKSKHNGTDTDTLRGEQDYSSIQDGNFAQEIYRINDEGEVDLVTDFESTQSLSTSVAAPAPSSAGKEEPSSDQLDLGVTSLPTIPVLRPMPREPTPTLLSLLDNVRPPPDVFNC